jgi:hypothetical protein
VALWREGTAASAVTSPPPGHMMSKLMPGTAGSLLRHDAELWCCLRLADAFLHRGAGAHPRQGVG